MSDQFMLVQRGPKRGIWCQSWDGYTALTIKIAEANDRNGRNLGPSAAAASRVAVDYMGLSVFIASAEEWAELEAMMAEEEARCGG